MSWNRSRGLLNFATLLIVLAAWSSLLTPGWTQNPPAPAAPASNVPAPIFPPLAPGTRAAYSSSQLVELRSPVKRASTDVEVPSTRGIYDAIARAFQISLSYDASVTE